MKPAKQEICPRVLKQSKSINGCLYLVRYEYTFLFSGDILNNY